MRNTIATDFCAQRKSAAYCGRDCQRSDWKTHKILCKAFVNLKPSPPIFGEFKLAIIFSKDEDILRLVWLSYDSYNQYIDLGIHEAFEESDGPLNRFILSRNALRGFNLPANIAIYGVQYVEDEDLKPNKACLKLAEGQPIHSWEGPFAAIRVRSAWGTGVDDITLSDFRHVVDFFREHRKPSATRQATPGDVNADCEGSI